MLRSLLLAISIVSASGPPAVPQSPVESEVFYHIFVRSFRDSNGDRIGDLRGIEEKLGYLDSLGVTSILLTPINPSPFYHNYFGSNFEGVDADYGDLQAFRDLLQEIHRRGMKLYLDQEIQYVTSDHIWYAQSLGQPASRYSRFVLYNGPGNMEPESGVFGLTDVPVYNGDKFRIASVNLLDQGVRDYFQELFAALVDPNRDGRFDDGVDGFRIDHMMDDLDLKGKLKDLFAQFWVPVFARAREVNPRVVIIAEQFDWGFGEDFLARGGVDVVFAFPIRNAIDSLDRNAIADAAAETMRRTPPGKGQLVFIENHDMNRFASEMAGDTRKERVGAALTILLRGTPLIYYGQEIGMAGKQHKAWGTDANDIPVREAFEWNRRNDVPGTATWYRDTGPWWNDRYARDDDGISVEEQEHDPNSLLSFYRRLLALRRSRAEIHSGSQEIVVTDRPNVLAVLRIMGSHASLLLVNLEDTATTVTLSRPGVPALLSDAPLRDLISGESEAGTGDQLRVTLEPFGIKLLAP